MRYPSIELAGAVAVITGGARGIGRATAERFAAAGATVCVGDLDSDAAARAAAGIGPRVHGYPLDVTAADSFARFVAEIIEAHGRIDVLVNNAGIMPLGDFLAEDDGVIRATFDVNVWGLIHGMRLVLPAMTARGSGHIVNVASMAGKLPIPGMAVYNASKFAAVGLSAAVRAEYARTGVSVTTILPSAVHTRLASGVALGRVIPSVAPADVARAIVASVASRRAEVTVPRYLAGWDLLNAAVPEFVMRAVRRVVDDRRALTAIDHQARGAYQDAIEAQARTRRPER